MTLAELATLSLAFAITISAGCAVVPRTVQQEVGRRQVDGVPQVIDARLDVWATRSGDAALLAAAWRRTCQTVDTLEVQVRTEVQAGMWIPDDPRLAMMMAFLAPAVIPVSGLITGLAVAADRPRVDTTVETSAPQRYGCDAAAGGVQLRVAVAGQEHRVKTDATGRARVDLGQVSPEAWRRGVIVVDGGNGAPTGQYPLVR